MNCGIGDVENLAFKIAEAEQRGVREAADQRRRTREQKMLEFDHEQQRIGALTVELAMELLGRIMKTTLKKAVYIANSQRTFKMHLTSLRSA